MPKMLNGVPRYGGKGRPELNKWIRSLLPEDVPVYCEPFGGVASILLNRSPAKIEVVNDLSSDMYNWLRVVRDYPDEIARLLTCTPTSRDAFDWALEFMERSPETGWLNANPSYVTKRALAYHILLEQGRHHGELVSKGNWGINRIDGIRKHRPRAVWRERITLIHDRIIDVQLENRDGVAVVRQFGKVPSSLVYADPVYLGRHEYKHNVDRDALTEAFLSCLGKVAVSGYPGDWDHLNWTAHRLNTRTQLSHSKASMQRTQVVWTNYDPPGI